MKYVKVLMLALLAVGAVSAVSVSAASATNFECEKVPCLVEGTGTGGIFEVGGTSVECEKGLFKSEDVSAPSETLLILALYHKCKAFGIVNATVNMNGCDYTFHTNGTVDIGPAGCGPISIKAATCEVTVGAQTGLSSVTYTNEVVGGKMVVKVTAGVKSIVYHSNESGFGCAKNNGSAEYRETVVVKGLSPVGTQTGVLVL
jgi:hypothetical protein